MNPSNKDIVTMLRTLLANRPDVDAVIDNEDDTALNLLCQANYYLAGLGYCFE